MTEDRRAHDRIDGLELAMEKHLEEHRDFENHIKKAVELTQQVANNTEELVEIFRGAKGLRKLVTFAWPFLLVLVSLVIGAYAYLKGLK